MAETKAVQAVLFDFDGTLVDTLPGIHEGWVRAFEKMGLVPPTLETVRRAIGPTREEYVRIIMGEVDDRELSKQVLDVFREIYKKESMFSSVLFPGVAEMLAILEERGLKLAIASNKPHQQILTLVEDVFKMKGRFYPVLGPECVPQGKPAPDLFLACATALGINPDGCVVVGDTPLDMEAGRRAGMRRIAVRYGYGDDAQLQQCQPEYTVMSPGEIPPLLAQPF